MQRDTTISKPTAKSAPEDVVLVTTWKVACDGGEGALGHPRVWLSLAQDTGEATCGYCDKIYRAHAQGDH
jgi:uncharacterized Zn-finger protein